MIQKMNGCTGVTPEGPCGGKDISLNPTIKGTEVEVEARCNTCGKTQVYKMPVLNYVSPVFIKQYNENNPVV